MTDKINSINQAKTIITNEDDQNVKKNEQHVPENLQKAETGKAPDIQKKEEPEKQLSLKEQTENVIADNLTGKASELAKIASSAIRANVPMEDIEDNLSIAVKDKVITEAEASKIVEIAHMVKNGIAKQIENLNKKPEQEIKNDDKQPNFKEGREQYLKGYEDNENEVKNDNKQPEIKTENKAPEIKVENNIPKITNKDDLIKFVKEQLKNDIVHGEGHKTGSTNDDTGNKRDLYEFKGLCFRADNRNPNNIKKANGFTSRNDLKNSTNMLEAQGLLTKKGIGATGHSGVSTAMQISKCAGCLNDGSNGRIYIIDSTKIGENEHGYSMKHITLENKLKETDETGGEVNFTYVPPKAIVGWIKVSDSVIDAKYDLKNQLMLEGLGTGETIVEFNELYGK